MSAAEKKPTLSVVMIARDEGWRIAQSLRSASFADEVIVADTGSTDDTVKVAKAEGARVVSIPFGGFGPTKQAAINRAEGEWVLSLDADEVVSEALRREIERVIAAPGQYQGFVLPRQAWFLGRAMQHGGWGRDEVLRLFRRERGRLTPVPVHERIEVDGPVGRLRHALEHHTDPFFTRYLAKIDRYSTLGAERLAADPRRRTGVLPALGHSASKFLSKLVIQQGWRDGAHGFLLAVSSAYASFLRYLKADFIRRGRGEVFTARELHSVPRRDPTLGQQRNVRRDLNGE